MHSSVIGRPLLNIDFIFQNEFCHWYVNNYILFIDIDWNCKLRNFPTMFKWNKKWSTGGRSRANGTPKSTEGFPAVGLPGSSCSSCPPVMQRSSTAWRMWCIVSLISSLLSWLFSPLSCSLAHCSSGLKRHVPREGRSSSFALIISLIPCFFSPQAPDRDLLNLCDISFSRLWHHHLFSSDVMVNKCGCLRVGIF